MKLERNHNIYQVIDKSIEEINKDLETIDFELGVLNFSQKMRTITASVITAAGAINTFLYVEIIKCLIVSLLLYLSFLLLEILKRVKEMI